MNLSELARRLHVPLQELRDKLPALGFDLGGRAIKVDDHVAAQITEKWSELRRRERVQDKFAKQLDVIPSSGVPATPVVKKDVAIPSVLTVRDFTGRLGLPLSRVIQELVKSGILASVNDRIDFETAGIIAEDLGFNAVREVVTSNEHALEEASLDRMKTVLDSEDVTKRKPRPPVVVVMGHVDHGKTTILDAIRKTNVVGGEAGGITQHIGAYQVVKNNRNITFIDTPGHEAFTVMRSRGAKVADVAIIVVAADDGVQPQTREVVSIVKAAQLPFVVAMNKMDKLDVNPDHVKTQLSELGLVPEDWGGKTIMVPVSAKKGTGIDTLLDMVLLVADLDKEKITANPDRLAVGTVIESHLDKAAGPVATLLVQAGTLHAGDLLGIRGDFYGRVRTMKTWNNENVKEVLPGTPVKVLGFKVAPSVGDIVEVAAKLEDLEVRKLRSTEGAAATTVAAIAAPTDAEIAKQSLNIVLKTDALGSLEALLGMLEKLSHAEVAVKVISKGLGNITEADILQAEGGQALVCGFNVAMPPQVEEFAREKKVEVKRFEVIYALFDEVRERLEALLPKEIVITELGKLEVLAIFRSESGATVAGGRVLDGKLTPGAKIRISRAGQYVGEGILKELQTGRQAAKEARGGQECGLRVESKTRLEVGDRLEAYLEETHIRSLVFINENAKKR